MANRISSIPRHTLIVFSLLCVIISSSDIYAANRVSTNFRFPLMTWFAKYSAGAQAGHYKPDANLDIPAVWLFSPQGIMVSRLTTDNELALNALVENFPPPESHSLIEEPSLDALRASFSGMSEDPTPNLVDSNKWTAVLFLSDSSACEHCASFDQKMQALEKKSPEHLAVIRVTLTD